MSQPRKNGQKLAKMAEKRQKYLDEIEPTSSSWGTSCAEAQLTMAPLHGEVSTSHTRHTELGSKDSGSFLFLVKAKNLITCL